MRVEAKIGPAVILGLSLASCVPDENEPVAATSEVHGVDVPLSATLTPIQLSIVQDHPEMTQGTHSIYVLQEGVKVNICNNYDYILSGTFENISGTIYFTFLNGITSVFFMVADEAFEFEPGSLWVYEDSLNTYSDFFIVKNEDWSVGCSLDPSQQNG